MTVSCGRIGSLLARRLPAAMLGAMAMRESTEAPRLPKVGEYRILQGLLGELVLRPWFDWIALRTVAHGYFPLSRAWAAALASGTNVRRFLKELPGEELQPDLLGWALQQVERRRAGYGSAVKRWETAFFGPRQSRPETLIAAELARHRAAHELMATRYAFLPLVARLPAVKWQVASPKEVEARHAPRLRAPQAAFPESAAPAVEPSRPVAGAQGPEHWLRYRAPVMGDTAWARVSTPEGAADPPTLIFLHGIGMENEMWRGAADPLTSGAIGGLRVIRPEGPWHGRRRLDGWYGGEPAIGRGPLGMLDLFHGWVAEVACLIGWARTTSTGPVAVGGVSLGALSAQLVAVAARHWPAELRPDALFLAATSGTVLDVAESGSLAQAVKLQPRIEAAGWTRAALARWLPLLEPAGPPAMSAERIVMLIGESDDLTQHEGGLALARAWGVPEANLFSRRQGHFSVSLGLLRDRAPLQRLAEIMGGTA
jgi:pimeloyl-ACP methyl ester carboxylesterase